MNDFALAWYWALAAALVAVIFGLRRGLCDELHHRGWLRERVNRFWLGAELVCLGLLLNVVTWGAYHIVTDLGLGISAAVGDLATDARLLSRPMQTLGAVLMLTGLVDRERDAVAIAFAAVAIFLAAWLAAALT